MSNQAGGRSGAIVGLLSIGFGGAAGALERGWPSADDSAAVAAFVEAHRSAILGQSMLFVVSAGMTLWFLAAVRDYLMRAEGGTGPLSSVVFGAGCVWAALHLAAQALQVGVAMAPTGTASPPILWTMAAMFSIGNFPMGVALIATAVVSLRTRAFPIWLGWISVLTAGAQMLLFLGTVVRTGPMAPNGWLIYVLYPFFIVWLIPTAIVMLKRAAKPASEVTLGAPMGAHA